MPNLPKTPRPNNSRARCYEMRAFKTKVKPHSDSHCGARTKIFPQPSVSGVPSGKKIFKNLKQLTTSGGFENSRTKIFLPIFVKDLRFSWLKISNIARKIFTSAKRNPGEKSTDQNGNLIRKTSSPWQRRRFFLFVDDQERYGNLVKDYWANQSSNERNRETFHWKNMKDHTGYHHRSRHR